MTAPKPATALPERLDIVPLVSIFRRWDSKDVATHIEASAKLEEYVRRYNAHEGLVAACEAVECACSIKERVSGHLVGCWMPDFCAALAASKAGAA